MIQALILISLIKGEAMKKIVAGAIFLIGFSIALSTGLCQAKNLVTNGDFETKTTDTQAEGWLTKTYRGTSAEFAFNDAEKHGGSYSYMIQINPPGGSVLLYPENKITHIKPGKKYQLSVWVKAKGLGYSPNFIAPAIRVNYKPSRLSPVPTIDLMLEMKGENNWKNLTIETVAPADAKEITLDFLLTKGTIWVDDVEITEVE
jgi:hypothetical protein